MLDNGLPRLKLHQSEIDSLQKRMKNARSIMETRGASEDEKAELNNLLSLLPIDTRDIRYTTPITDGTLKILHTRYGGAPRYLSLYLWTQISTLILLLFSSDWKIIRFMKSASRHVKSSMASLIRGDQWLRWWNINSFYNLCSLITIKCINQEQRDRILAVAVSEVPNLDLKPGTRKGQRTVKTDGRIKMCEACGTKHLANLRKCRKCKQALPRVDSKSVQFAEDGDPSSQNYLEIHLRRLMRSQRYLYQRSRRWFQRSPENHSPQSAVLTWTAICRVMVALQTTRFSHMR